MIYNLLHSFIPNNNKNTPQWKIYVNVHECMFLIDIDRNIFFVMTFERKQERFPNMFFFLWLDFLNFSSVSSIFFIWKLFVLFFYRYHYYIDESFTARPIVSYFCCKQKHKNKQFHCIIYFDSFFWWFIFHYIFFFRNDTIKYTHTQNKGIFKKDCIFFFFLSLSDCDTASLPVS